MKKISLVIFIAVLVIALTGCSVANNEIKTSIDYADSSYVQTTEGDVTTFEKETVADSPVEETVEDIEDTIETAYRVDSTMPLDIIAYDGGVKLEVSQNDTGWTVTGVQFEGDAQLVDLIISSATYSITEIGDSAFKKCTKLRSVDLSRLTNLTRIGAYAFYDCSNLTSITIPASVTTFGTMAFYKTPWLNATRNNQGLLIVNNILVDGLIARGNVTIPSSVTSMAANAFAYNEQITSVVFNIDNQVTTIPRNAFYGCKNLTEITLNKVEHILDFAFYGCKNLTTINAITTDLQDIGDFAFNNCTSLTALVFTNSPAFRSVGNSAFKGCTSLATLAFNKNINTIKSNAFSGCVGLLTVEFEENSTDLQLIGDCAFYNCSYLSSFVNLPQSATKGLNWKTGTQV